MSNFQADLVVNGWGISCETALIWVSLDHTCDKSTLVQVMAWCRQATSHYLGQCWSISMSPYGVTKPQWVKINHSWNYCSCIMDDINLHSSRCLSPTKNHQGKNPCIWDTTSIQPWYLISISPVVILYLLGICSLWFNAVRSVWLIVSGQPAR